MTDCVHRWRISEPNGSHYVTATCQLCGASRDYLAGEPSWDWRDERTGTKRANITLRGTKHRYRKVKAS